MLIAGRRGHHDRLGGVTTQFDTVGNSCATAAIFLRLCQRNGARFSNLGHFRNVVVMVLLHLRLSSFFEL